MMLPLSLGLLVLMLVLAGNFVYWAINSVVNQGMGIAPVIKLFLLAAPGFAVQGIPAGVILAVCLVLNRAVRDNEILALRGGGASLPRIVAPFLVVAALSSLANYLIVERVSPHTNRKAEKLLAHIMASGSTPFIDSDRYFRVGPYYFYVGTAQDGVLRNVMIYERADARMAAYAPTVFPVVRTAQVARENPQKPGQWLLEKGTMQVYNTDGTLLSEARFERAHINVEGQISQFLGEQKQPFSMTGDELSQKISEMQKAALDSSQLSTLQVDYYRRFALPGACFVMALCAAPLALRYARHGSFAGLVSAFLLAFLWQGFDGWFRALGIAGYLPPVVAAGATNALFLVVGVLLMVRER